jgi:hypothetical protein
MNTTPHDPGRIPLRWWVAVSAVLLATLAAGTAGAIRDVQEMRIPLPPSRRPHELRSASPLRTLITDNTQTIGVNNIRMFVTNTGSFAWDKASAGQPAGFEFPKGTGRTALYAAGLWLGARINGGLRLAVSEYSDEYRPGSAVGGYPPDDPNKPGYKVYKLNRLYNDPGARDAALAEYTAGAVPHGAPPVSLQPDGTLNILGDEMMWAVYNDLDSTVHINRADNLRKAMGIEVQQTTFAFAAQGALNNTIFIKYKFINRGPWFLDEMYASQWSDPDLGGATDDLVGCDVSRSIGFVYNATNTDGQYGSGVPSVGFDFFKGPIVGGSPLGLASFNKYINATDPNTADKTYNYMQGLLADGSVVIDPTTGSPTRFQVSGDPTTGTGWLDSSPADRRMMLTTGPFSMAPGDSQEIVVGIVVGQSVNRTASVALMKFYDEAAQSAFDLDFNVPPPPDPPAVTVTPSDGAILLTWDNHAERYSAVGYHFEGYVVYQGASVSGPFTRLATFDIDNGITTVLDPQFDEESYVALPKVAAQGNDGGIRYEFRTTTDVVRGLPLYSGTKYYYTVRSYSVGLGLVPQVKESADTVRTVIPQTPPGGVDLPTAGMTAPPTYHRYNPALAPTTDHIQVIVKDQDKMLDASYVVGYKPDASGIPVWYVTRTTAAGTDTVVNDLSEFSGDEHYPIFDGVQVKLLGAPYHELLGVDYVNAGPQPAGLVPDPGIGAPFWDPLGTGGGADYAANNFGSSLDPAVVTNFSNVEIRFTGGPPGQKAYRYLRCDCAPRTYLFQDYVDVPFTVWDLDNNRQLNCGFLENFQNANGFWNPDTVDDFLGAPDDDREFIQVYASTYDPASLPVYTTTYPDWLNDAASLDLQYYVWPKATATPLTIDAGDKIAFVLASRSANDYFAFSTRAPDRANVSLAQGELARVKAVPNPYFAHSSYELDQFNRVIRFTHLPQKCTIRLFTLAGSLIRTIQKDDATSQVIWNLETDNGLPVGSGVYVFHVDAPGVGNKVGKVAVFVEKERLNNY